MSSSSSSAVSQQATELPDSLQDAAQRAAEATTAFVEQAGPLARCRVDFDTSVGDETYTILKTSTEFMQEFVSSCCYAMIPGLQQQRQDEMMRVVQSKAELRQLLQQPAATETPVATDDDESAEEENNEEGDDNKPEEEAATVSSREEKIAELQKVIELKGRAEDYQWEGPVCRIYFPDAGSAALAQRDWLNPESPKVPPCVQLSSCGGVQVDNITNDRLVFFCCPKASESDFVEEILQRSEQGATDLQVTCLVNPNLVDMGVTGLGMAGRMLRERLIDPLQHTYYLRTLAWGALTRKWPSAFSVWQEDDNADGGYRLIKTLDRLPSNPEVEDIYDIENGAKQPGEVGGLLDQLGDFVNGMMRL